MSTANQANRPITESNQELAVLVEGMGPLVLALSAVHMSGRLDIIRSGIKPKPPAYNADQSGSLSLEDAAKIRGQALEIIKAYRDAGQPPAYRPTEAELHEMMNFLMGLQLPADYVPMICEDMAYDGEDARAFRWSRTVGDEQKARYPVIVIGAGMSGMLIGLRLKQAGLPFLIIEKNDSVGGTWFENRYPGLRVDVPSHAYSFSFVQDHSWSGLYSLQAELLAYFRQCAERFGIGDHIRYRTEVAGADWNEQRAQWDVTVRCADGSTEVLRGKALVSAAGFFNRPNIPEFKNAHLFQGSTFHSACWRDDVPLAGRRVAIIGTAATAMQMIPEVAKIAKRLTVYQRSPGWTSLHPEYDRKIRDAEHWAIEHLPFYAGWLRTAVFNWTNDLTPDVFKVDPNWPQNGRSTSAMNEMARARLTEAYKSQLAGRPDLLAKLLPDYPPFVKRPTVTNGNYFSAFKQSNVELVIHSIEGFTREGIRDETGRVHELDVVIYATGFQVQKFLTPMVIRGHGEIELNTYWQDRPGGYLGIVVPRFPNFFMMYGPGTNLGYNGNLIFNSELQARYIAHCLRFMVEENRDTLELRQEVFDDYMDRTSRKLEEFVWAAPYGTTYFRNAQGRVTTNSPWSLLEMWSWTKRPDPAHFLNDSR